MLNMKASVAGVCAVVASGAGAVAVLEYMNINPFKPKPSAEAPPSQKATVQATSLSTAPTIVVPPQVPAANVSMVAENTQDAAAVIPTSSRVDIELKSAQLAKYESGYYFAAVRFKITNSTKSELKAVWLDPNELMTFTAGNGSKFSGARNHMKAHLPSGIGWCASSNGVRCWELYSSTFTTLQPGESVTAVMTLVYSVNKLERKALPKVIDGTFSAPLYVVDSVTKARDTQIVSMDFEIQNPEGL